MLPLLDGKSHKNIEKIVRCNSLGFIFKHNIPIPTLKDSNTKVNRITEIF